jgi:hypothetical protein
MANHSTDGVPGPANDTAPGGEMRAHTACEKAVLQEIVNHGQGTARSLAVRLGKQGVKYRVAEVQAALDGWVSRGWCAVIDGKTHITCDAIAYMR